MFHLLVFSWTAGMCTVSTAVFWPPTPLVGGRVGFYSSILAPCSSLGWYVRPLGRHGSREGTRAVKVPTEFKRKALCFSHSYQVVCWSSQHKHTLRFNCPSLFPSPPPSPLFLLCVCTRGGLTPLPSSFQLRLTLEINEVVRALFPPQPLP